MRLRIGCLFLILLAMGGSLWASENSGYIPSVSIIGDVVDTFVLGEFIPEQTISHRDQETPVISVHDLVSSMEVAVENFDLVFAAQDFAARIPGDQLEEVYLSFSEINGWEVIAPIHPRSTNVKELKEIIVVANEPIWHWGINVISPSENLGSITPGQLLIDGYKSLLQFEGTSSLTHDDKQFPVTVYTPQRIVSLEQLLPAGIDAQSLLVVGNLGKVVPYEGGQFTLVENRLDYIPDRGEQVNNVRGIVVDPPVGRTTDAYHDALDYLEDDQAVLLFILDGLGYHQYQYVIENQLVTVLSEVDQTSKVMSVYQPVTNAGVAAILTGTNPDVNGVYSRRQRMLQVPDVFESASDFGKTSAMILGDRQIVGTSVVPVFNLDLNDNGTSDDEIYEMALQYVRKDFDLLVVHYKSIDQSGHNYGDFHSCTIETIVAVDGYLKDIVANWDGVVIITADHGMHSTDEGGLHGYFRYEDMFVPYLTIKGGKM